MTKGEAQRAIIRTSLALALIVPAAVAFTSGANGRTADHWTPLRRPLHLPKVAPGAHCPTSRVDPLVALKRINICGGSGVGRGPVYPALPSAFLMASRDQQYGGPWFGEKVFWYVLPSYRGRALIRGRRLDGPQRLGFNGRRLPGRELRIDRGVSVGWEGQPPGSRGIPSGVRVRASGCYGVQIDGTSFSRVVVFRVEAP